MTRSLMASVPAVALVAVGAVFAVHGEGAGSPAGSPATSHPAVLTAAYVTKQVEATLSSDDYIIESTGNSVTFLVGSGTGGYAFQFKGSESTTNWDPVTGNIESVEQSGKNTETAWMTSSTVGNEPQVKLTVVYTDTKSVYTSTTTDFWVNTKTFHLVKLVLDPTGSEAAGAKLTYYFRWLPRTQSLVAQVNTPQIPAGYHQDSASK
jgi:hypothetical protein